MSRSRSRSRSKSFDSDKLEPYQAHPSRSAHGIPYTHNPFDDGDFFFKNTGDVKMDTLRKIQNNIDRLNYELTHSKLPDSTKTQILKEIDILNKQKKKINNKSCIIVGGQNQRRTRSVKKKFRTNRKKSYRRKR